MEQSNNNQTAALLVMDVQGATVKMLKDSVAFFDSITLAIKTARSNKIPVLYIVVGFRKGYPEVSPNNKNFSILKNGSMNLDREDAFKVHASVAPRPGDLPCLLQKVRR